MRLLVGLVVLSMSMVPGRAAEKTYDVVIAGAGTGGVSAAIEAARHGASVALLEETDWIGGQMTAAGVSNMDEQYQNVQSGLYWEFLSRVQAQYAAQGKTISTCYWSDRSHCFEPRVGQNILYEMIAEARKQGHTLDVLLRTKVARVLATGNRVEGIVTSAGTTIRSKVLIDATEYGDVLPLVPGEYRIGKYTGKNVDPNGCVQWITYTAVVKKYPNGVPEELRMKNPPPGYAEVREKFARQIQTDGNPVNRVLPVNWAIHNGYRGLPDSSSPESYTGREPERITKTVLNWFNDFPVPISWFDHANRKRVNCEAKLKTLQFLYYVQHDLQEPLWSVANDEGYDTPYNREENLCENIPEEFKAIERHFPVMPYVRESRRLVGVHTLTAADIRREGVPAIASHTFASSIALGDYAVDLHGCAEEPTLEFELERSTDRPAGFLGGLFQVPIETLIPQSTDGFLAAEKNISQTRLANGATRLQPITMLTGQAAGLLAALAVESGIPPRKVSVAKVQKILLDEKSALSLAQFQDVPRGHELWPAVQLATARGWMSGVDRGHFGPAEPVKRRTAAVILAERAELNEFPPSRPRVWRSSPGARASFEDVPLYDQDAGEIEALRKVGATTACSTQPLQFCPDAPITRAEFVEMLSKVLKRAVPQPSDVSRPITRGEVASLLAATAAEQQGYGEAAPVPVQASYAGVYGAPQRSTLTVVFEDNKLFARAGDDVWFRLYPTSASEFVATANTAHWMFVKDADGRVSEVVARSGSTEIRRRRIP
ncbi:FAD-dependent oxidoreductase [uncultured Paludibaculum sp.]|uniref:FAD-dependent oxidoreductase n=1 Tax=uncultured Paludibaculum sp. TaxID=1765020 RepID=UPI002AAB4086|nr:FAD-dependent oxidoreductase [uncultured Paludibaculum sp.]